ncbi:hypothetical protein [Bacillus infantis]|uniref:hypothetical protein n=1 Tax=Bacillus infantis TaxID=324767 RepID=UPI0020A221AF|nr:hypothetical protein [Bacillus infantis]MCP1159378.1 hypothetical protein [Bacillus infantis]
MKVRIYFTPEKYVQYISGEECTAYTERVFESDIECEVKENEIEYSKGGLLAYTNIK